MSPHNRVWHNARLEYDGSTKEIVDASLAYALAAELADMEADRDAWRAKAEAVKQPCAI